MVAPVHFREQVLRDQALSTFSKLWVGRKLVNEERFYANPAVYIPKFLSEEFELPHQVLGIIANEPAPICDK